jgi:phosphate transport system substrate-binding protein
MKTRKNSRFFAPKKSRISGKIVSLFILFLWISLIAGCSSTEEVKESREKIRIAGSGSGSVILKSIQEPFNKKYPNIKLDILPTTGTGDGIRGVSEGLLDIGVAARKMKSSEKEKYPNVDEATFAKDVMVLAVNENVEVESLTSEQIKKIFSGEITDWSEVGGQKGKIVLLDREESESSKILLREQILGSDLTVTDASILMTSADAMNKAIEKTPNSLGQTSLGVIKLQNLNIKPIAVDGVMPSTSTIKDGSYKLVRSYGIVFPKGGLNENVKAFVDYVFSEEAKQILKGNDFVAVPRPK